MIRIIVSVAAFALAMMLFLVSGLRLPFSSSSKPETSPGSTTSTQEESPSLLQRLINRTGNRNQSPSPTAQPLGQAAPNTTNAPNATTVPSAAPLNQPANPRAEADQPISGQTVTPSPTASPAPSATGLTAQPGYSYSRGTAMDRPDSKPSQPPARAGW